jgi:beta-glucosidase
MLTLTFVFTNSHDASRYGLSYTTFTYKWDAGGAADTDGHEENELLVVSANDLVGGARVNTTCVVTNTGDVTGDAVVLGFVSNSSDPLFPRQKLFDFARVTLSPGESRTVTLHVTAQHLSVVDDNGARWVRPAVYSVRVGDVVAPATLSLRVTGEQVLLEDISTFLA